jgi:hypothetical protein
LAAATASSYRRVASELDWWAPELSSSRHFRFSAKPMEPPTQSLAIQAARLLLLAIPVACVAWTVRYEEVFREPREYCQRQTRIARSAPRRKFFYLFPWEYCFSHYVVVVFLTLTRFPSSRGPGSPINTSASTAVCGSTLSTRTWRSRPRKATSSEESQPERLKQQLGPLTRVRLSRIPKEHQARSDIIPSATVVLLKAHA